MTMQDLKTFTDPSIPENQSECQNRTEKVTLSDGQFSYCCDLHYGCQMINDAAICDRSLNEFMPVVVLFDEQSEL